MCTIVDCHLEILPDGTKWIGVRKGDPCRCGSWKAPHDVTSGPSKTVDFPLFDTFLPVRD